MSKKMRIILLTIAAVFLFYAVRTGNQLKSFPECEISTKELLDGGADLTGISVDGNKLRADTGKPEMRIALAENMKIYEIQVDVSGISRQNCRSYMKLFPDETQTSLLLKNGSNFFRFENASSQNDAEYIVYNPVPLRGVSFRFNVLVVNPHSHFIEEGVKDFIIVSLVGVLLENLLAAIYTRFKRNERRNPKTAIACAAVCGIIQCTFTATFLGLYFKNEYSWDSAQTTFFSLLFMMQSLFVWLTFMPDRIRVPKSVIKWQERDSKKKKRRITEGIRYYNRVELPFLRIILLALMFFAMTETLYSDYMVHWKWISVICNPLLYAVPFVFMYCVIPGQRHMRKMAYALPSIFWFSTALINHYYFEFRAQAFEFSDLSMASTARNVMGSYKLEITPEVFLAILAAAGVFVAITIESPAVFARKNKITFLLAGAYVVFACIFINVNTPVVSLWNTNTATKYNGYAFSYLSFMKKSLEHPVPADYSAKEANEILSEYEDCNIAGAVPAADTEKAENIIVVMNEAFSDLPAIYGFDTDTDVMPYIHSLSGPNVKRGFIDVSVFGGTTADTEYEFLTGNSLTFLNGEAVPYTQYINSNQQSIVSRLAGAGFSTSAFHPYLPNGYKRNKVYPLLGFEQFVSSEDNLPYMNKMRSYCTDESDYLDLIDLYENRKEDKPFFIFNVTMQNHGGYSEGTPAIDVTVKPTDEEMCVSQLEEYLSLVHASDEAFRILTDYYSNVDENTLIVMFGDHQPGMDEDVYEMLNPLMYEENANIKEKQKKYMTPYVLWANYDLPDIEGESVMDTDELADGTLIAGSSELGNGSIERADVSEGMDNETQVRGLFLTSPNYLGTYVLQNAGLELNAWEKQNLDVRSSYPVMNVNGFADAAGKWHGLSEMEDIELLQDYKKTAYLNLFDHGKMNTAYFE